MGDEMKETVDFLTRLVLCLALTLGAIALVSHAGNGDRAFECRYEASDR